MKGVRGAAAREEEAELEYLRDQADRSAADAGQTLGELTERLAVAAQPGAMARWIGADARAAAARALRRGPGQITGQRGARVPALAGVAALVVAAAVAYAAATGKIKFGHSERTRRFASRHPFPFARG